MFLMKDLPRGNQYMKELLGPIREGIQSLENDGLIERRVHNTGGSNVRVTRAGLEALESPATKRPG
jgi:DNA-binding FadR family transcriptional regulator